MEFETLRVVIGIALAFIVVVGAVGYVVHKFAGDRIRTGTGGGSRGGDADREGRNGGDERGRGGER